MRKGPLYWMLFILIADCSAHAAGDENRIPALIPAPNKIEIHNGHFAITSRTVLLAEGEALPAARLLNHWLGLSGLDTLPIRSVSSPRTPFIAFSINSDTAEAYSLRIKPGSITLSGSVSGLLRGTSTLFQLLVSASGGKIPCLGIQDQPKFAYRGVHLDVCRHFMPKEFVLRYIDVLALHKMNTFHWHLTEDQGWRIEIRRYPELTRKGAWRQGSMIGPYRDQRFDSIPHGGFYTQEEIREVVRYAQDRGITVIPEIEMPGHAMAALAAYPQYSCTGRVTEVARGWGVFDDVFCVNDSTFAFLEGVLTEVMELFPSRYIHIGGDECPKTRWKECPKCQATMKANGLRDEHELQSHFIRRIERFLNGAGRQIIGWDEILEGGLAPNATVMSWRGTEGGIAAARDSHQVVMTPGSHCYFDHYQGERNTEPLAIGGYTPLEKVYAYRPIPAELNANEARYIVGAQANVWTEYMYDTKQVEYMLLPRLCAFSEVLWTDTSLHNLNDFYSRLTPYQQVLKGWGLNYSTTWLLPDYRIEPGTRPGTLMFSLQSKVPQQLESAWGTPDTKPVFSSYTGPIALESNGTLYIRSNTSGTVKTQSFEFEFSKAAGATVTLEPEGDKAYRNPGSVLTDARIGSLPWTGKQWVGWLGKEPTITLDLGRSVRIDSVAITYLHDPVSWIHAPRACTASVDTRETRVETGIPANGIGRIVIPVDESIDKLFITVESIGKNPEGNAGAGEDGWIFISEIQVY
jgi:hexosaminidase